ncbi:MAG: hypothetical protein PHV59_03670, partial [Victivallales bacterium]|nr:hypothetical protein [Victivallales bacterium]
ATLFGTITLKDITVQTADENYKPFLFLYQPPLTFDYIHKPRSPEQIIIENVQVLNKPKALRLFINAFKDVSYEKLLKVRNCKISGTINGREYNAE